MGGSGHARTRANEPPCVQVMVPPSIITDDAHPARDGIASRRDPAPSVGSVLRLLRRVQGRVRRWYPDRHVHRRIRDTEPLGVGRGADRLDDHLAGDLPKPILPSWCRGGVNPLLRT